MRLSIRSFCIPIQFSSQLLQNPALRYELSYEMGQVQSDASLHFGLDSKGSEHPNPVLEKDQKCHRKADYNDMIP